MYLCCTQRCLKSGLYPALRAQPNIVNQKRNIRLNQKKSVGDRMQPSSTFRLDPLFEAEIAAGKLNPKTLPGYTLKELEKLLQAIEVHGYRGPSRRKHNGVVPIRPTDSALIKRLEELRLRTSLKIPPSGAIAVKAVAHVPSGYRLVGFRLPDGEILILGMGNYAG